jgi:aspartyl-tRNA synthetase
MTNRTSVSGWNELNEVAKNKEFPVFNAAELVVGIAVQWKLYKERNDALIEWVKRPQVGASGMVYVKNEDGITNHP